MGVRCLLTPGSGVLDRIFKSGDFRFAPGDFARLPVVVFLSVRVAVVCFTVSSCNSNGARTYRVTTFVVFGLLGTASVQDPAERWSLVRLPISRPP